MFKDFIETQSKTLLNQIKNEFGATIKIVTPTLDLSNPAHPRKITKSFPIKALLQEDSDTYNNRDITTNKEYKICSILIDDIIEVNNTYNANIPIPPSSLKKNEGTSISIDNGSDFQITSETVDGLSGMFFKLRLERDY